MNGSQVDPSFWHGKQVLITGHTGFKGSWLSLWLTQMGAKVTGYALSPHTTPNLFDILQLRDQLTQSYVADIRDLSMLQNALNAAKPEVVIHMAAQPLVRHSYVEPVETFATNVMGTVHLLESVRHCDSVRATVIVTTDKCYDNREWVWGYRENDPMGGQDPYSSSKGCAELVTAVYRSSYFSKSTDRQGLSMVASARAGNVIGGGDWSADRLIPDAIRSFSAKQVLSIRNPHATRPWQHVLEPLSGYIVLAQRLYNDGAPFAQAWNFGPHPEDTCSVQEVVEQLIAVWGQGARWVCDEEVHLHEARALKLDISKAHYLLAWKPHWNISTAIEKTVEWYRAHADHTDMLAFTLKQIDQYEQLGKAS